MATQLSLFDAERRTREFWELTRRAIDDASVILTELLRESGCRSVTFRDIVKRKMGIAGDSIPEKQARDFADQVDAVTEERLRIKEAVEEHGEFMLTVVDTIGRPAIRGGSPDGFAFRQSEAGENDTRARIDMATGQVRAVLFQQRQMGRISDLEFERLIGKLHDVQQRVLTFPEPVAS